MSSTTSTDKNLQVPLRKCDVCGRTLTPSEAARLAQDIDFVEHDGHLIRSVRNAPPTEANALRVWQSGRAVNHKWNG